MARKGRRAADLAILTSRALRRIRGERYELGALPTVSNLEASMNISLRTAMSTLSLVAAAVAAQGCAQDANTNDGAGETGTTEEALLNWPRGSYRESCSACSVQGGVLSCTCGNEFGGTVQSSIEYHPCNRAINNINGVLECDNWPGPQGSFSRSCPSATASGSYLQAQCYDVSGNLRWSSIDVASCAGYSLTNYDGQLICGG
jgi:hypothetical protein